MTTVRWTNGRETRAAGWEALLEVVASLPWNRHLPDIRKALAQRAYVWSGTLVDPALPAEDFWLALEGAGLVEIIEMEEV